MPNIKLYYFDGDGRAEIIRLILAQGDIKYKDERIQVQDWPTLRNSKFMCICCIDDMSLIILHKLT